MDQRTAELISTSKSILLGRSESALKSLVVNGKLVSSSITPEQIEQALRNLLAESGSSQKLSLDASGALQLVGPAVTAMIEQLRQAALALISQASAGKISPSDPGLRRALSDYNQAVSWALGLGVHVSIGRQIQAFGSNRSQ
jgi:hypothetical protein